MHKFVLVQHINQCAMASVKNKTKHDLQNKLKSFYAF